MSAPVSTLIPNPNVVELEGFISHQDTLTIRMRSIQAVAACPRCDHRSKRIHSHYVRHLADLPWHGVAVRVSLKVRKFFCDSGPCAQKIFTERLPEVVRPYGRCTIRLENLFSYLGFVSGGEEGARISRKLNVPHSADTMLRGIKAPQPSSEQAAPRVVGIDEFAFRKGHRYGTILVDLERRVVIDLLPDCKSDTVIEWLQAHPQIEIISRDRSGTFAEAASRGAPQARQVADRWHLLKNVSEAVTDLVTGNAKLLKEACQSTAPLLATQSESEVHVQPEPPKAQRQAAARRDCRLERYNEIIRLHSTGVGIREIARKVGVSRKTVRRFLRSDGFPERAPRKTVASKLDSFKPYVLQRWEAGCHNAAQIYQEIAARGYDGGASICETSSPRCGIKGPHLVARAHQDVCPLFDRLPLF